MSSQLHITEVGRVAVPASDQDAALDFYVGTLGFELRADETFADGQMRWIEVAPAGASTSIALTPPMEGGPTAVDTGIILSSTDIDADHAALKALESTSIRRSSAGEHRCRRCSGSATPVATRSPSSSRSSRAR